MVGSAVYLARGDMRGKVRVEEYREKIWCMSGRLRISFEHIMFEMPIN